jgi:tyrosyl-tRNA synthetase
MVMPILVGIDGHEKMSKSMGNYIAITDSPGEMFGKVMRLPDEQMGNYFELLTEVPEDQVAGMLDPSKCNPRDTKEELAKIIIARYHPAGSAEAAAAEFRRVHAGGGSGLPDEIPEISVPEDMMSDGRIVPIDLTTHCGFAQSRGEARRLIAERGLRLNGKAVDDAMAPIPINTGDVLQRGKRRFARLIVP